ncbi:Zinc finger protein 541 [Eumeta japonica]|uniref:Zinc finger protein 541 n=1 Tax=Eumeta variegata TaxID=151549 RepID=A0A4C1YDY1_EUMVA|nr:Zinc finger protein 541 [Eumeta japonica]
MLSLGRALPTLLLDAFALGKKNTCKMHTVEGAGSSYLRFPTFEAMKTGYENASYVVCNKIFGNASALAKHKLTHSDERKYVCGVCAKAFKRQDHLNGHMLTHRNKKPYECKADGCGKSYCDARSLRRHTENHHQPPHDNASSSSSSSSSGSVERDGAGGGAGASPASPAPAGAPHQHSDVSAILLINQLTRICVCAFNATPSLRAERPEREGRQRRALVRYTGATQPLSTRRLAHALPTTSHRSSDDLRRF